MMSRSSAELFQRAPGSAMLMLVLNWRDACVGYLPLLFPLLRFS